MSDDENKTPPAPAATPSAPVPPAPGSDPETPENTAGPDGLVETDATPVDSEDTPPEDPEPEVEESGIPESGTQATLAQCLNQEQNGTFAEQLKTEE